MYWHQLQIYVENARHIIRFSIMSEQTCIFYKDFEISQPVQTQFNDYISQGWLKFNTGSKEEE